MSTTQCFSPSQTSTPMTSPTPSDDNASVRSRSSFSSMSNRSKTIIKQVSNLFGRSQSMNDDTTPTTASNSAPPKSRHSGRRRRSITVAHIADSLPRIQSNYAEAFHIVYYWLKDNELNKTEKKKFSTDLWYQLYLALPDIKDSSWDFSFAGDKIVSVFEWMLRDFVLNRQAYGKIERRIHSMTQLLSKYFNITHKNCDAILDIFHVVFGKYFGQCYSQSVRISFSMIFMFAVDVSNGSKEYSHHLLGKILLSFEDCLDDPIGRSYFEGFVREQMCGELMDFVQEWRELSGMLSSSSRLNKAKLLVDRFIESDSPLQINIPGQLRIHIIEAYQVCTDDGSYRRNGVLDIYFQKAVGEVLRLLRTNFWRSFVDDICHLHDVDKNQFMAQPRKKASVRSQIIQIPPIRSSQSNASPFIQQSSFVVNNPLILHASHSSLHSFKSLSATPQYPSNLTTPTLHYDGISPRSHSVETPTEHHSFESAFHFSHSKSATPVDKGNSKLYLEIN